jgi:hypothetical protein
MLHESIMRAAMLPEVDIRQTAREETHGELKQLLMLLHSSATAFNRSNIQLPSHLGWPGGDDVAERQQSVNRRYSVH